jgi:hypothetical protein
MNQMSCMLMGKLASDQTRKSKVISNPWAGSWNNSTRNAEQGDETAQEQVKRQLHGGIFPRLFQPQMTIMTYMGSTASS